MKDYKLIKIEAHKYVKTSNAATLIHYFMKDYKLTIICFLYVISLFYERL